MKREMNSKLMCSCIRNPNLVSKKVRKGDLPDENTNPKEGDIVIVESVSSTGAYTQVENTDGRPVDIVAGDIFIGVLATRSSGTNPIGTLPGCKLKTGSRVDLLAQGGIIGHSTFVPRYYGSKAMELKIISFIDNGGEALNLEHTVGSNGVDYLSERVDLSLFKKVFVCGTSAETGKTSFTKNFNLSLKSSRKGIKTAALKLTGTGRKKDFLTLCRFELRLLQ